MVANAKVAEDTVYRTARALYEGKADLVATFPPFALFNPANMAKPVQGVPPHPGATRFYREIGLIKN